MCAFSAEKLTTIHSHLPTRAALYEAYLQLRAATAPIKVNSVDAALAVMSCVALDMLRTRRWATTVGAAKRMLRAAVPTADDATIGAWLRAVPSRVEDINDDSSAFAFWHKSLGEYLCARQLHHEPVGAMNATSVQPWSLDAPLVLAMFGELCLDRASDCSDRALTTLKEFVTAPAPGPTDDPNALAPTPEHPNYRELVATSNAAALVAAAGFGADLDLRCKHLWRCNLRGMQLGCVAGSRVEDCEVHGARVLDGDIEGSSWPGTTCEIPLPPLEGHMRDVNCVCFTPDDTHVISASDDASLIVWSLHTVRLHNESVTCVAAVPNTDWIVSGSRDEKLFVWSWKTGEEMFVLSGHTDDINSVACFADSKRIVSGSRDTTVRIWSLETRSEMRLLADNTAEVRCVAVTSDRLRVASAATDDTIRIFSSLTGVAQLTFNVRTSSIDFSPDGLKIATAGDFVVECWDTMSGNRLEECNVHTSVINCCRFSSEGTKIVSCSDDLTVRIFDLASHEETHLFSGHMYKVLCATLSHDSRRVASCSADASVSIWSVSDAELPRSDVGHTSGVSWVSASPDGATCISASDSGALVVWDLRSGAELRRVGAPVIGAEVRVQQDWSRAVIATNNDVYLWTDFTNPAKATCTRLPGTHDTVICDTDASQSGDVVASADFNRQFLLRRTDSAAGSVITLPQHLGRGGKVRFIPGSTLVVTGGDDRTIRISDGTSGAAVRELEWTNLNKCSTTCLAVSDDGQIIVGGGWDSSIRLWRTEGGANFAQLRNHNDCVWSTAFADGSRYLLATGSQDHTAIVYRFTRESQNAEAIEIVGTFEGHSAAVTAVCFTPDHETLLTGSSDRTVRVWTIPTKTCVRVLSPPVSFKIERVRGLPLKTSRDQAGTIAALRMKDPHSTKFEFAYQTCDVELPHRLLRDDVEARDDVEEGKSYEPMREAFVSPSAADENCADADGDVDLGDDQ